MQCCSLIPIESTNGYKWADFGPARVLHTTAATGHTLVVPWYSLQAQSKLVVGYSYGGSAKRHVELSRSVMSRMRVHDLAWASPMRQPRRGGIGRRYVSQGTHEHMTSSYPVIPGPYPAISVTDMRTCARTWAETHSPGRENLPRYVGEAIARDLSL